MRQITSDVAALVLRVVAGLIFIPHGWTKVLGEGGPAAFASGLPGYGIPAVLGYVAAYAELVGGAFLILGFLTRLDAFLLACTMGVAAFVVKLPDALYEVQAGQIKFFAAMRGMETELALLAMTIALLIMGAGRISLDAVMRVDECVAALFRRKK